LLEGGCHQENAMSGCGCGSEKTTTAEAVDPRYRRVLWIAFGINAAMFVVEVAASLIAGSVALQADALDFFGDAMNYGVSLVVLGMALKWRARVALGKGIVMGCFGVWVLALAVHHAVAGGLPQAEVMSGIGILALACNVAVALMLFRFRGGDSNQLSVWLCSRNDAIANVAIILAGVGVWATGTNWPDIAVGAVIAALGLSGAYQVIGQAIGEVWPVRAAPTRPA
jgi:Co/Zn/Cd efflux system component